MRACVRACVCTGGNCSCHILPGAGFMVQGRAEAVVLQRQREEDMDWVSRHGPSSSACTDTDTCGTTTSALSGNSFTEIYIHCMHIQYWRVMDECTYYAQCYLGCSSGEVHKEYI